MANALFDKGREAYLNGAINWTSDNIKVLLVDSAAYTLSLSTHDFRDDIAAGVVATSANLASKTSTDGVADAADITFPGVTGVVSEYLIIFQDTGTPATSHLIACIDTAAGLPVTPNGGDIGVTWDNGANKIFRL